MGPLRKNFATCEGQRMPRKNIKRKARSGSNQLSGAIATELPKLENFGFRSEKFTILRGHSNQWKGIAIRLAERDNLEVKLCI